MPMFTPTQKQSRSHRKSSDRPPVDISIVESNRHDITDNHLNYSTVLQEMRNPTMVVGSLTPPNRVENFLPEREIPDVAASSLGRIPNATDQIQPGVDRHHPEDCKSPEDDEIIFRSPPAEIVYSFTMNKNQRSSTTPSHVHYIDTREISRRGAGLVSSTILPDLLLDEQRREANDLDYDEDLVAVQNPSRLPSVRLRPRRMPKSSLECACSWMGQG